MKSFLDLSCRSVRCSGKLVVVLVLNTPSGPIVGNNLVLNMFVVWMMFVVLVLTSVVLA